MLLITYVPDDRINAPSRICFTAVVTEEEAIKAAVATQALAASSVRCEFHLLRGATKEEAQTGRLADVNNGSWCSYKVEGEIVRLILHEHSRYLEQIKAITCTCQYNTSYTWCGHDGGWHQHSDDPCPVHPDTPTVG